MKGYTIFSWMYQPSVSVHYSRRDLLRMVRRIGKTLMLLIFISHRFSACIQIASLSSASSSVIFQYTLHFVQFSLYVNVLKVQNCLLHLSATVYVYVNYSHNKAQVHRRCTFQYTSHSVQIKLLISVLECTEFLVQVINHREPVGTLLTP